MNIYKRVCCAFILAALVATIIGIMANTITVNRFNRTMLEYTHRQVESTAQNIETQLKMVNDNLYALAQSPQVNLLPIYFDNRNYSVLYEKLNAMSQRLQMFAAAYYYLEDVGIMFGEQEKEITNTVKNKKLDDVLFNRLKTGSKDFIIEDGFIIMCYPISTYYIHDNWESLVYVRLPLQRIIEHCSSGMLESINAEIISSDGDMYWPESMINGSFWSKEEDRYISYAPIEVNMPGQRLFLKFEYSGDELTYVNSNFYVWTVLQISLLFICTVFFIRTIHSIIGEPLTILLRSFDIVANGNTKVQIDEDATGEFAEIYAHFNNSIKKLDMTIRDNYLTQVIAQKAEIKYLQSQIQPHFLYNAFYQMYRICRAEDCEEASEYALLLSEYYEYIAHISDENGMTSLRNEIDQAQRYLSIQKFRYQDRMVVILDIDNCQNADIDAVLVPKMVLQPLVENIIRYCVEGDAVKNIIIKISLEHEDNYLILSVEDSGTTMSDDDILMQTNYLSNAKLGENISGLSNVHMRLQLTGLSEGLKLSRSKLGGLKIQIALELPCSKDVAIL